MSLHQLHRTANTGKPNDESNQKEKNAKAQSDDERSDWPIRVEEIREAASAINVHGNSEMKGNFQTWLKFEMEHECVFERGHYGDFDHVISENVPGDAGGLTKFGIDQRSHPHVNIRALDYDGAAKIYRSDYWNRIRGDELPNGYDIAVGDIAVNNGTGTAARLLQRACNHAKVEPPIKEDGFIGPNTIAAANKAGADGLEHLLALRENHYYKIVERNPSQHKFMRGWLDRNKDLARLVAPNVKGHLA